MLAGWLADDLRELSGVSWLAGKLAGWRQVLTRSTLREVGGYKSLLCFVFSNFVETLTTIIFCDTAFNHVGTPTISVSWLVTKYSWQL